MRRAAARFACALALAAALAAPRTAAAPEDEAAVAQAKQLFHAGADAYAAGRYAVAIQAFEAAYRLAPRPAIVFSLAQAERKEYFVGKEDAHLVRAIKLYRDYLASVASGGRRVDAVDALSELEPLAARVDAKAVPAPPPAVARTRIMVSSQTPDAFVSLDGAAPMRTPLIEEVTPGLHLVRVEADGHAPEEREVLAMAGMIVPLELPLRELPARVSVAAVRGADVAVDGRFAGTTPLTRPLQLTPGVHVLAITKNGHRPVTATMTLARGTERRVSVTLEPSAQRKLSYVVVGTGAASIVAGGVLALLALGRQESAQEILATRVNSNIGPGDLDAYNDALSARDDLRTVAVVTVGAGAVLGAAGALLYAFDRPTVTLPPAGSLEPSAPAAPRPGRDGLEISITPTLGPKVFGAGLRATF